jgi:hypothetical protein
MLKKASEGLRNGQMGSGCPLNSYTAIGLIFFRMNSGEVAVQQNLKDTSGLYR